MCSRRHKATVRNRMETEMANGVPGIIKKLLKETRRQARSKPETSRPGREASHDARTSAHGCDILGTGLRHRGRALDSCRLVGAGDDLFGLPVQFGPGAGCHRYL